MSVATPSGSGDDAERLSGVIAKWRTSLVDLSGRNRLLNFRHTRAATLEIVYPAAADLVAGLERGWDFEPLPEEESEPEQRVVPRTTGKHQRVVTQKTTAPALFRAQSNLRKKATQVFNDYGIWTLQLGIGMLNWREDGAVTGSDAPLVLFPASLERTANGRIRLALNEDEEPKLNPALPVKLEQFHIDWSSVSKLDPTDLTSVLAAARSCIAGKPGWQVTERVVLGQFASHKESMYKDLLDNEEQVMQSDLIKAIALGPAAKLAADRFDFEEIPLGRIDELAPPEESPLVLDADSSQRQAVAAAVAGNSFVMDGPPGTGKSQTIANMIAGLISAGRSVLFVSEKAAALDVVLDRLRAVGLGSYALALHSNSASRGAVAKELGRALDEEPSASGMTHDAKMAVREAREALTGYADAMNETRDRLGRTLHDVIGRIGVLSSATVAYTDPHTPDGGFRAEELSSRDLDSIIAATEVISRGWAAIADSKFPWRDVRRDVANARPALAQALAALGELMRSVDEYRESAGSDLQVRDERDVERLINILTLVRSRLPVPQWWLTTPDFAGAVEDRTDQFLEELDLVHDALLGAQVVGGRRWQELPTGLAVDSSAAADALSKMSPAGMDLRGLNEKQVRETATNFRSVAEQLERTHGLITELVDELGLEHPQDVAGAYRICEIIDLTEAQHRPLDHWLIPNGATKARHSAVELVAERVAAFKTRRDLTIRARDRAVQSAGREWEQVERSLTPVRPACELALEALHPAGLNLEPFNRKQLGSMQDTLAGAASALEEGDVLAGALADRLGCPNPDSVAAAEVLVEVVEVSSIPDRALKLWFDAEVLAKVREAVTEVSAAVDRLSAAESHAKDLFLPTVIEVPDLPDVISRLDEGPRGIGALFSKQVRSDRKLIAATTVQGAWQGEHYDALPLALEWHDAYLSLRALCESHGALLGRFVDRQSVSVDSDALNSALAHAEEVHRLAPTAITNPVSRESIAGELCDGGALDPVLRDSAIRLRELLGVWRKTIEYLELHEKSGELARIPLGQSAYWAGAHAEPLQVATQFIDMAQPTIGRYAPDAQEHSLGTVRAAIAYAHDAQVKWKSFQAAEPQDRELLGRLYDGLNTSLTSPDGTPVPTLEGNAPASSLIKSALVKLLRQPEIHISPQRIEFLDSYAPQGNPSVLRLSEALEVAESLDRLAPATLKDPRQRMKLVSAIAGRPGVEVLQERGRELRGRLVDWERMVSSPELGHASAGLIAMPADDAAKWFRNHSEAFSEVGELLRLVGRVVDDVENLTVEGARSTVVAVSKAREAEGAFLANHERYRGLMESLYEGIATKPERIREAVEWSQSLRRAANNGVSAPLDSPLALLVLSAEPDTSLQRHFEDWRRQRNGLLKFFARERRRELENELSSTLVHAFEVLDELEKDPFGPETWVSCKDALGVLSKYHLDGLPSQLAGRGVSDREFPSAVERAVLVAWVEHLLAVDGRLKPQRAIDRDNLVSNFQQLDLRLIEGAHADVIAACNARRPRKTTVGQAAILRREAGKQRRHMPVRRLLDETRDVVRRVKPCFMMSPLTVSQFLSSDYRFDVVIFDEASQVLPQDAVNSIYRGDALVVAGDARQLPPTSFFSAANDRDDDDEWDEDDISFESILDGCKASGVLRSLPLRWHYRSRHENLIAFSNFEFYDNSMITFPSAREDGHDIGVEYFKVDGIYDRGGRRDNQIEATRVAERVIHHFVTRPDLTLGVVAFSKAQAEAIEVAVEQERRKRPDLAASFTEDRLGGFFVKNLETVQGDERDVIILSVGYGPDAQGRLRSEFGPINREAGWRRLNVAVTRARRRVEVVASFRGSELSDSANKSVHHLKRYLEYAEHGPNILETEAADPDAVPESPFEQEVLDVLNEWGYTVQPQVGVAGFRIDMAVRHPDAPGAYALGIECDGAMYHSSRAARDRDRLRESVLRDLGWELHRIWGTDWYRNRSAALTRLREAVEAACTVDPYVASASLSPAQPEGETGDAEQSVTPGSVRAMQFVPVEESTSEWAREYEHVGSDELWEIRDEAVRESVGHWVDLRESGSTSAIAMVVLKVLDREGPIEEDLIFTRVRTAWALSKSGKIIQQRIRAVLMALVRREVIVRVGSAYNLPDREITVARTPSRECLRKVVQVPAVERQFALKQVVAESPGIVRAELLREVARFFGWGRTGSDIRAALTGDLDWLMDQGVVVESASGTLSLV